MNRWNQPCEILCGGRQDEDTQKFCLLLFYVDNYKHGIGVNVCGDPTNLTCFNLWLWKLYSNIDH